MTSLGKLLPHDFQVVASVCDLWETKVKNNHSPHIFMSNMEAKVKVFIGLLPLSMAFVQFQGAPRSRSILNVLIRARFCDMIKLLDQEESFMVSHVCRATGGVILRRSPQLTH